MLAAMEWVLFGLHWETCLVYIDDIIIFPPDFDTYLVRIDAFLERIAKAGLKISPGKCQLFQKQVGFLGHIVSAEGIATAPRKTATVEKWPSPKSVKEICCCLGLCSYYKSFVHPRFEHG